MRVRLVMLLGAGVLFGGCGEEAGRPVAAATSKVHAAAPLTVTTPSPGRQIAPDEIEARFRALLREAGVNLEDPTPEDVARTWQVVRDFSTQPVRGAEPTEEEGDAILAQYGVYDWMDGDGEHFELDMTRQLIFGPNGDDDMFQLNCSFSFPVTAELRALGDENLWSFDMELDEFFEQALAMPGFRGAHEQRADPVKLDVAYGGV